MNGTLPPPGRECPMTTLATTVVDGWTLATGGFGDGEPRIRDIELAERLGFGRPRDIRSLIASLARAGKLNDVAVRDAAARTQMPTGTYREVAVREYWLTEAQALKVCAKSETTKADALLDEVIRVFVAVRRGTLGNPLSALSDPATLRRLLGDYAERVERLEGEVESSRPKVEVYDRIVASGDTVGFREACKLIFAGTLAKEPEVRTAMQRWGWIQRLGGRLAPAYYGQEKGYVTSRDREIPTSDGGVRVVPELRITQRGVARAIERLGSGDLEVAS